MNDTPEKLKGEMTENIMIHKHVDNISGTLTFGFMQSSPSPFIFFDTARRQEKLRVIIFSLRLLYIVFCVYLSCRSPMSCQPVDILLLSEGMKVIHETEKRARLSCFWAK